SMAERDDYRWFDYNFPLAIASLDAIRLGDYSLALKLCEKLSNEYRYSNLNEIAGVLTTKNKIDSLEIVIDKIDNADVKSDVILTVVRVFADSNRLENAMNYLGRVKNPDHISLANAAIAKCEARNMNFKKAVAFADHCSPKDKLNVYAYILNQYSRKRNQNIKAKL
ncbi:MAG TPA: hypothetical protein VGE79_05215, partial [Niastella sp.]